MSRYILKSIPGRLAATAVAALLAVSFLLAPVASQAALFGTFGVEDERELGKKYNTLIRARYPVIEDPEIVNYVKGIVDRIYKELPPQPFEQNVTVIRSSMLNAFATPGGYVYVFTGLITEFENEAELAGVIAHELAHVSQRHVAKRIEQMQYVQMGMLAGVLAGWFLGSSGSGKGNQSEAGEALIVGSMAGAHSAILNYSRMDEREADQVGMNFLVGAGYAPQGMVGAFEKIRRKKYLSGSSVPQYLSTHPDVDERIGYLEGRIKNMSAEEQAGTSGDEKFQRVKMLVRARFADTDAALGAFSTGEGDPALEAMGRGIVHSRRKRVAEATEAFDEALKLAPNDPLVLREAGRFHYKSGDAKRAGRFLSKASILNPEDLIALYYLARLQADKGNIELAEKYYQRILDRLPEDAEVHFHLGRALGESGDSFGGHLHLAYAGVFGLNKANADRNMKRAKALAKTEAQKKKLEELEAVYKSRAEYW